VRFPGLSRKNVFYELLEKQAEAAFHAARTFQQLIHDFDNRVQYAAKIKKIEHEADNITHKLANLIDSTFVTPMDKEDLHALSSELDDVTDSIEACTGRLALYEFVQLRPDMELLVSQLVRITEATLEAVKILRTRPSLESIHGIYRHIHEIETEHDGAFRRALANLINAPGADPIKVIKWKEIYDRIEAAVDKCEDACYTIESVVVKYA
jgi:predicted phosphate transport protein (TIGR00153 family)